MKNLGYEFHLLYGFVGIIMLIAGVALMFTGVFSMLIIGIVLIIAGAILTYIGVKAVFTIKRLIAEQKIIDADALKAKQEAIASGLCPKCGNKVQPEDEFCSKCGQNLKK
ncbi:MAG: zinc-ribbon domain-containing protein [Clostridia bacterium]